MTEILVKYASRSRPENFMRGLRSIFENAINPEQITVLVSLDIDDPKLNEYDLSEFSQHNIIKCVGTSKNKIDAINRDVNEYEGHWDILVNFSDDMVFTREGWDDVMREEIDSTWFYYGKGFVFNFTDPNNGGALMTMSVMDYEYYIRDRYIYHPSYESVWCDNEAQDVAKKNNRFVDIHEVIFDHLHPANGKAMTDAQYQKTESAAVHHKDHQNYLNRKQLNFPA
jgi:hypothetical protein